MPGVSFFSFSSEIVIFSFHPWSISMFRIVFSAIIAMGWYYPLLFGVQSFLWKDCYPKMLHRGNLIFLSGQLKIFPSSLVLPLHTSRLAFKERHQFDSWTLLSYKGFFYPAVLHPHTSVLPFVIQGQLGYCSRVKISP